MINFLDYIFPPRCGFCRKINSDYFCKKCETKLKYLKEDKIIKTKDKEFSYLLFAYQYKDEIRNKILSFKFGDKPELSDTFVKVLLNNQKICGFLKNYDIIIPVPMQAKKKKIRGYNQTELIAKKFAIKLGLEYLQDVLKKCKSTAMQSSLSLEERQSNVIGAYKLDNVQKILNKKIILFDDIYTTGSTARECVKTLKIANPKEISVLVLAKD